MKIKNDQLINAVKKRIQFRKYRKWYYSAFVTLAAVVVFCTVYALILPAITLEKNQAVLDCPLNIHQHTAECYDDNGTLTCGQADFVIHTHNESCYNAVNELVCKLPEITAHEHTDDCYEERRVLICTDESSEHTHTDDCYEVKQALICTNESDEHTHTDDCYHAEKTLACEKAEALHMHSESCYNAENELVCELPEKAEHEHTDDCYEVKQALICTNESDEHAHTDDCYHTEKTLICEEAEAPHTHSESCYNAEKELVCELPEKAEQEHTDDCYQAQKILACKETSVLHTHDETCRDENGKLICGMLQVTEHVHGAACFQPAEPETEQPEGQSAEQEEAGFQPDIMPMADTNETWGYNPDGSIWWIQNGQRQTANRLYSASAPNTVLNMFDYWTTANRYDPDNSATPENGGINNGHAFKFSLGDEFKVPLNEWVGGNKNPLQGMVNNLLSESGYPVLSGKYGMDGYDASESLEYLFNPNVEHEGKVSYRDVRGLLAIDSEGYYSFDCREKMAEFDEDSNSVRNYDKPSAAKGFYPFNKAPQIMTAARNASSVNHYFGMTITTRFVQLNEGHINSDKLVPTIFEFSGDDDVWIFIDDVLVGDVGGIHDASSVSIDFSTGKVSVQVNGKGEEALMTTLYDQYAKVGKTDTVKWNTKQNGGETQYIFADDTSHTLKFFYLERGNYDSNLVLKYNLTEIPVSGISKVDQYGDAVPGAAFTAYAADENYQMLYKKDGAPVTITGKYGVDWNYDGSGNIVDSSGKILARALYTGTTGVDGMMVFAAPDSGKLYSIDELEGLLGNHFILRETKVPEGYRIVYKDAHLQIWKGENQKIIKCDNTLQSGVRASSNLQITATDELHLRRKYKDSYIVQHNQPDDTTFGTLFAVVFRYTGKLDENGNIMDNTEASWTPVYGNDRTGYQPVPVTDSHGDTTAGLVAALEAAKRSAEMNGINDVVFHRSSEGSMQLTIENLPGHITTYYRLLAAEDKQKAQYTVAYYWTDQNSLEKAAPENTYRVYTFGESTDGVSFSPFERKFGATIRVPNLTNRVFVQKLNEENELTNGATFAIYSVQQDETTGAILYLTQDGSYVSLSENAVVGSDGVITDGANRISPLKTDVTKTYGDGIHTGTSEFINLSDGQYIIKEVKAPPGYKINTADVMVLVTEDTIYANAGTADDGITVGRGPGYLVTPLDQFASLDQIDNTLTWIYTRMLITGPSTSFYDIGKADKVIGYLKTNNSCEVTQKENEAFRTNLIYQDGKADTAFNYVPDSDRNKGGDSDGYRRLFTTVGWNYYSIFQDYTYGLEKVKVSGANYENWSGQNLMNLFSRSTYIRVTDEQEIAVTVKKVDEETPAVLIGGAEFRMYKTETVGDREVKLYYGMEPGSNMPVWTESPEEALVVTTADGTGLADKVFTGLKNGVYFLEEVKAPDGYYRLTEPIRLEINKAELIGYSPGIVNIDKTLWNDSLYTYTVTVSNSSGYVMPSTGGSGTIIYTIGGMLLMAVPLVYGYRKKRKSERRAK